MATGRGGLSLGLKEAMDNLDEYLVRRSYRKEDLLNKVLYDKMYRPHLYAATTADPKSISKDTLLNDFSEVQAY